MRNMSFSLTTPQIRNHTKTVTRRLGWANLKPGDRFCAIVKGMGLKKGEKVQHICTLQCVSNRPEALWEINVYADDCQREGFPDYTPEQFITMFCLHNECDRSAVVNRIEFKYV